MLLVTDWDHLPYLQFMIVNVIKNTSSNMIILNAYHSMMFNFYKFIVAAFGNVVNSISEMEIFSYRKKEFYFLVCDFHIAKGQNKSLMNDFF